MVGDRPKPLETLTHLVPGREALVACAPPNRVGKETMKVVVFHWPRFVVSHFCYTSMSSYSARYESSLTGSTIPANSFRKSVALVSLDCR